MISRSMQVMHTAFARGHSFQDVPTLPSLNLAFFLGYFLEQSYLNGLPSYAKNTDTDMLPFFFFFTLFVGLVILYA